MAAFVFVSRLLAPPWNYKSPLEVVDLLNASFADQTAELVDPVDAELLPWALHRCAVAAWRAEKTFGSAAAVVGTNNNNSRQLYDDTDRLEVSYLWPGR